MTRKQQYLRRCREALKTIGVRKPSVRASGSTMRIEGRLHARKVHTDIAYDIALTIPLPDPRVKSRGMIALKAVTQWLESMALLAETGLLSPRDMLLAWVVRQGGEGKGKTVATSLNGGDCLSVSV
jgi:hypothetical protein